MKTHVLSLLMLATSGLALAQKPIPFTVKGKIGQLNLPAKIYLLLGPKVLDSATFKQGTFALQGTTDMPRSAELVLKRDGKLGTGMYGPKDATRIFLEPGPVVVLSPDSLLKATVTGGAVTADAQKLKASLQPLEAKVKAMGAEYGRATEEQRKDPAFAERMQAKGNALFKEYAQGYLAFARANPNSWVSLDALQSMRMFGPPQYAQVAPIYEALSPALKNSPGGREYGEMLSVLRDVAVGVVAPNFTQQTPDGKQVSLTDYRGKYVLVDFWASWCGPCRAENPAMTKVYNEYKSRNFDILGVSLDDQKGRAKWLKAIADDRLAWTQVSDLRGMQNVAAVRYHVKDIPQNFLVDPSGKIVATNLRGDDLRAMLAQFIK